MHQLIQCHQFSSPSRLGRYNLSALQSYESNAVPVDIKDSNVHHSNICFSFGTLATLNAGLSFMELKLRSAHPMTTKKLLWGPQRHGLLTAEN